ncbi:hypothetical protein FA95DRAFT_1678280 [Auriscalpium vulgare]|uniref:Uncharacterized protein n=1 Tax=Auriscalpium vulgare TaxID=40419 RepID=A0ACB8RXV4_9AGAM|nr:hypothetical protein FA95DRAFT_1678280 [Auriscalpium vulgare]
MPFAWRASRPPVIDQSQALWGIQKASALLHNDAHTFHKPTHTMLVAPEPTSVNTAVVHKWYEAIADFDADALGALFTEDYVSSMLPKSLGVPDKGKQAGLDLVKGTASIFEGGKPTKVEVYRFAENAEQVWAHTRLTAKTVTGLTYDAESIYIFTLEKVEKDPKIKKIAEFADSAYLVKFQSEMAASAKQ